MCIRCNVSIFRRSCYLVHYIIIPDKFFASNFLRDFAFQSNKWRKPATGRPPSPLNICFSTFILASFVTSRNCYPENIHKCIYNCKVKSCKISCTKQLYVFYYLVIQIMQHEPVFLVELTKVALKFVKMRNFGPKCI